MTKQSDKNNFRQKCRALRYSFGEKFIECASNSACNALLCTPEFELADTVLIYYPIKNEISPLPILKTAKKLGKAIAFPLCINENRSLVFKAVTDLSSLSSSNFGLSEPKYDLPNVTPTDKTICIVPALAFSKQGHRLGYGMGYYDSFLRDFRGKSIGFSYSELIFDDIPHEDHDIPLDMIITESEVLYFA